MDLDKIWQRESTSGKIYWANFLMAYIKKTRPRIAFLSTAGS